MKCFRVQITTRTGLRDARGENLQRQAEALGIAGVERIAVSDLYFLEGALDSADAARLAERLLCDPVVEDATVTPLDDTGSEAEAIGHQAVEVVLHPGVTDSVAENLLEGACGIAVGALRRPATISGRLGPLANNADNHPVTVNSRIAPPSPSARQTTQ